MADKTDPASAEEQPAVPAEATVAAVEVLTTEDGSALTDAAGEPLQAPEPTKAERITALIRNGLTNTAISQSSDTWLALNTRLPEIVAAILSEV